MNECVNDCVDESWVVYAFDIWHVHKHYNLCVTLLLHPVSRFSSVSLILLWCKQGHLVLFQKENDRDMNQWVWRSTRIIRCADWPCILNPREIYYQKYNRKQWLWDPGRFTPRATYGRMASTTPKDENLASLADITRMLEWPTEFPEI